MTFKASTGVTISAPLIGELVSKVNQHEVDNGRPRTPRDVIEHQVCMDLEKDGVTDACSEDPTGMLAEIKALIKKVKARVVVELNVARKGIETLSDWIGEGYATQEEADQRAKTCVGCPSNVEVSCAGCAVGALLSKINKVLKGRRTPYDGELKHCEHCGCTNRVKVWVPKHVVLRHTTEDEKKKLPGDCWILQ